MTARAQRRRRSTPPRRCRDYFERAAAGKGYRRVAGLDEAGRGCLFGPVFAAAVILSPLRPIRGLQDSKKLEPEVRSRVAELIRDRAVAWAVARAEAAEIDRINILQASRLAMKRALEQIAPPADYILVDALSLDVSVEQRALIRGDARCRSIAAASILAKVDRDRAMADYDQRYPAYGLARNKGYGTPEHLRALRRHGPTPEHRMTFAPVREHGGQMTLFEEAEAACP